MTFADVLRIKSDKPTYFPSARPTYRMSSYAASQQNVFISLSLSLFSVCYLTLIINLSLLFRFASFLKILGLNVKEISNTTRRRQSRHPHGCRAHLNKAQCGESPAPGNSHPLPLPIRCTDVDILSSCRISHFYDYLTSLRGETSNLFNDLSRGKGNMSFPH